MKKFESSELFYSSIKAHPRIRFFCYDGKIYVNDTTEEYLKLSSFLLLEEQEQTELPEGSILTENLELLLTEDGNYLIIE